MPVARLYHLEPREGAEDALAAVLAQLVPAFRALPGCTGVALLAERAPARGFTLLHWWESEAAHQAGVAKLPRDLLGAMMAALPGIPEGRYLDEIARA